MKKTLTMGIILLFAGLVITSCNKSSDEISAPQAEKQGSDLMAFLQTPQGKTAMEEVEAEYKKNVQMTKGSEFITPFFSSDGFGVINFESGLLGFFSDEYDENDFWRVNPDGTISVHQSSNTALGEAINLFTGDYAYGENCNLSSNYTGT